MDRNTHITRGQLAPIRSDDLDVTNSPSLGQVPSLGADGQFTWITPIILVDNFTIINNAGTLKIADRIEQNIMLLAFYRAIDQSKIIYNLVDGFIDEYEDESGIDTVNSINQLYNSSDDYYSPINIPLKEIDYMEYATDETAQSNYVTDDAGGVDSYTKLMLHLDNNVTDKIGKTVTNNNVTFSNTAGQYKWGYSGIFNGSNTSLTVPDSADWDFGSGDYTIDMWIYPISNAPYAPLIGQGNLPNSGQWFFTLNNGVPYFYTSGDFSGNDHNFGGSALSLNTWAHLAFVRASGVTTCYVNGVACPNADNFATWYDVAYQLLIGGGADDLTRRFNGYIDEIRVSKGIARWTSNFTPPTNEYGALTLQSYSEGTIKQQGSYSLKGIANITDSLNKTLTKTLTGGSKIDLSGIEDLVVYVRATRTGENLQLQFHDSGGTTSTFNITINSANTWEQKTLDISGISNANKNDIDKIIIKILNADAENTFYIDDFKSVSIMLNMTLISDVVIAEAEPSQTRIVLFEEDVDAITLNTDLKVYASIDGGSNYDQITLSDEGDWDTGKRILSGIVDVSARTGTNIKYKAITYNEKNLKLHGVTQSWA